MFQGLVILAASIWFLAIFFIVKGLREKPDIKREPTEEKPEAKETVESEKNREAPISAPAATKIKDLAKPVLKDFFREFGKANVVEFPAEYIDKDSVKNLNGEKINILEFAKNCYREIGFQCMNFVWSKDENGRAYKVNIFDLINDHYKTAEEGFINYFGRLKENFSQEIQLISHHPDITAENKKALVEKYESIPQLVVWNDKEFFLVLVKSKDEILDEGERDFFKEFVIDRKLFKAKIFKVAEKQWENK